MSISPNVGALSSYLNRIMTGQHFTRIKSEIKSLIKTIPAIGEQVFKFTKQMEESMKALIVPGALFEELGFQYVGPLEGHKLEPLIRTLANVRELNRPVLVHVLTKKGKGYEFAEKEPSRFPGSAPFAGNGGDISNPNSPGVLYGSVRKHDGRARPRRREGRGDNRGHVPGHRAGKFRPRVPQRFFDVGIAEQHGVTFAAGLAVEGLKTSSGHLLDISAKGLRPGFT